MREVCGAVQWIDKPAVFRLHLGMSAFFGNNAVVGKKFVQPGNN